MSSNKKNVIILCILLVILIVMVVFGCIYFSKDNSFDVLLINGNVKNELDDEYDQSDFNYDNQDDSNDFSDDNIKQNIPEENLATDNIDGEIVNDYTETDIVSYFETMELEVEKSTFFREKFKEYFITIVDFIFYDGEIKGYTFGEISGTAKIKIIGIALKIDSKIEEYVPNYKETISNTTGKVYTDIKEKLVTSYMDISSIICINNEEECTIAKEMFSEIKDKCKIGWDFVKGLINGGVSKIKEWYEIYSGK